MAGQAPYELRLDPDVAQQLADQGGALLILDLPEGSFFGIDHMAFHCGPRFRGIKMLPPGPHFACYSIPGSQRHGGGMGPVTGFFFNVAAATAGSGSSSGSGGRGGTVLVRRYDAAQELLVELPEEEAERYAHGVRRYEFDWGLAPYNLNAWRQWRELTSCLDARVIDAVQPVDGNICTALEANLDEQGGLGEEDSGRPATEAEAKLRQQLQEGRAARAAAAASGAVPHSAAAAAGAAGRQQQPQPPATAGAAAAHDTAAEASEMDIDTAAGPPPAAQGSAAAAPPSSRSIGDAAQATTPAAAAANTASGSGRCFYTVLPRLVKEAGLTPAQLTALNLDRTRQLLAAAGGRWGGDTRAMVGEAQFAFVAFVCGQSLHGFRQWRALVTLFLNCDSGPTASLVPTFTAFLATLRAQLAIALTDATTQAAARGTPPGSSGEAVVEAAPLAGLLTHGSLVEEVLLAGGGRDCFLRHHLGTFFEVLREAGPLDGRLQAEASELRSLLGRSLGWQFDGVQVLGEDSDDEYAPVVVELGEGEGL